MYILHYITVADLVPTTPPCFCCGQISIFQPGSHNIRNMPPIGYCRPNTGTKRNEHPDKRQLPRCWRAAGTRGNFENIGDDQLCMFHSVYSQLVLIGVATVSNSKHCWMLLKGKELIDLNSIIFINMFRCYQPVYRCFVRRKSNAGKHKVRLNLLFTNMNCLLRYLVWRKLR